jgi:hypothetical protein
MNHPMRTTAGLTALRLRLAGERPLMIEECPEPSVVRVTDPTRPGRTPRGPSDALLVEAQETTAARYLASKGEAYVASLAFQAVTL